MAWLLGACALLLVPCAVAGTFGHSLLPQFGFREGYINLNHGSYGSVPLSVTANQSAWSALCEQAPDAWYRPYVNSPTNAFDYQDRVRALLASYINASFNDTVFIDNASEGINTVMRSLARAIRPGQKVLLLNTAYYMVKQVFAYLEPSQTIMVNISMPGSNADIIASVRAVLAAHAPGEIFAASFSHIASVPAVILPVAELVSLCHEHSTMVLIDGAHALGHIPVDVTALNADFWLGNGHKWLYSPKGSAILWVRPDRQALIEPTVISWEGRGQSHFQLAFSYEGTNDYSRYLAMSAALDFRASVGTEAEIMQYMHALAVEGGRALAKLWGTELLFEDTSRFGAMVDVRLPTRNATLAKLISPALIERYHTWVPAYDLYAVGGLEPNLFYMRVSAQIYTEIGDFTYLGHAVAAILAAGA